MSIDTGDAVPKKQAARRIPFAVRQEVAEQLKSMLKSNVIQPSNSPWASPIVLVRKKDGTLLAELQIRSFLWKHCLFSPASIQQQDLKL